MNKKMSRLLPVQFLILSLILFPLILPNVVFGEGLTGVDVVPEQERRSCIMAADGYAQLSDYANLAEAKAAAFADAKRQVLEAAKRYLPARIKGSDFEAEYHLIWPDVEGGVTLLESKDHGLRDKTRYHAWVKAEVVYELKPKKSPASLPAVMGKGAPLTVRVWTPKKEYEAGESMEIYVQGNRDFYARIVDITSSGDIIQLLPNDSRKIDAFQAGKLYRIPDQADDFGLEVTAPYGEDRIIVYASDVPLGDVSIEAVGQGLGLYKGTRESLATSARGIKIVPDESASCPGAEFYEAMWAIATGVGGPNLRGTRRDGPEEPIHMTGAAGEKAPFDAPGDGTR
ncbi:MAG: DUF4384 domain-containing protein [Deltaproteobacteria bacterium]|nr:DUF4384 domain-containing protein [Deltaproteobacteria bacterium]